MVQNRRYPLDLSNRPGCTYPIEVDTAKRLELIPDFTTECGLGFFRTMKHKTIYFEKIHPEFAKFNFTYFIQKVERLRRKGTKVHLIALNREPEESIKSFLNYQFRNKQWYAHLKPEKVIDYFSDTYQFLNQLASYEGVLNIDYQDLKRNYVSTLLGIFDMVFIDSNPHNVLNAIVVRRAYETTRREKRAKTESYFFGEKESTSHDHVNHLFDSLKQRFSNKINDCHAYYKGQKVNA